MQALPPPNGDSQPWEELPSEGGYESALSQQGGHDTSGAAAPEAAPEAAGVPAATEAIDAAAEELMGLLLS